MPTIRFTESLEEWEEGFALATQANKRLPEVLGQSTLAVEGEWGLDIDDPVVTLRLWDSVGEVIGKFEPDELRSPNQTGFRLHRLLGKLLAIHTDELLKSLQASKEVADGPNPARPNLFADATSELSQDAFICWLLRWASPEFKGLNDPLHAAGVCFLDAMLRSSGIEPPTACVTVEVRRQFAHLDILAIVNHDIAVLIEDKTDTCQHSGQLDRYSEAVQKALPNVKTLAKIYFKTGDQGNYQEVIKAGFKHFSRKQMLAVLQQGREMGVESDIFRDYQEYLEKKDADIEAFRSIQSEGWGRYAWTGFFLELQTRLGAGNWKYVPNESGGFMGFWWHSSGSRYLLLNRETICFKVNVSDDDRELKRTTWKDWHVALFAEAKAQGITLVRTPRRLGRDMTVAQWPNAYRQWDSSGQIDMERTLAELRKVMDFHEFALHRLTRNPPLETPTPDVSEPTEK